MNAKQLGRAGCIPTITLRQPWAWAIFHAGKDIENRDSRTNFRGRVCFHVATEKRDDRAYHEQAALWMVSRGLARSAQFPAMRPIHIPTNWKELPIIPPIADLPTGVLLGTVEITDIIDRDVESPTLRWKMRDQYGYRLASPRRCIEREWKGLPGWFYVPTEKVIGQSSNFLALPTRMREAAAVVCAKCAKPVDSFATTDEDSIYARAFQVKASCHGQTTTLTFTEKDLMTIDLEGLRMIEVFR